jgi:uncharacterized protein
MPKQELKIFLEKAKAQKKANKKLFKSLASTNPKQLDSMFHEAHEEAFQEIDCLECANCCKTTSPIFRNVDINRISSKLKLKPSDFIDKYLVLDDENDYVLKQAPCPFLLEDNRCSIYEFRPQACREYPHTDRKAMHQILHLTSKNQLICPAVAVMLEKIRGGMG